MEMMKRRNGKETGHGRWRMDTRCCTQEETEEVMVLVSSTIVNVEVRKEVVGPYKESHKITYSSGRHNTELDLGPTGCAATAAQGLGLQSVGGRVCHHTAQIGCL